MRGTVIGEKVVSRARTEEFDAGYDRTFGKDRKPQRGRWIWDEAQQKLVAADEYVPPSRALDAPILAGRFYENTKATDGTDIGSRAKHAAYMKANGIAAASDFSPAYYEGVRKAQELAAKRDRHATVDRAFHDIDAGRIKPRKRTQED